MTEYRKVYLLGKTQTKKALVLAHGKSSKIFTMEPISNSPFTESEWQRYLKDMKADDIKTTTKKEHQKKLSDLKKAREFVFSDLLIDEMIKEKKALLKQPVNYATEKLELKRQIHIASQKNDIETKEKLENKVKQMEQHLVSTRVESKLDIFGEINKKNRQLNLTESRVKDIASEVVKVVDDCELVAEDFFDFIDLTPFLK